MSEKILPLSPKESLERYLSLSLDPVWCFECKPPIPKSLPKEKLRECLLGQTRLWQANESMLRQYGFSSLQDILGKPLQNLPIGSDPHFLEAFIESKYQLQEFESDFQVVGETSKTRLLNVQGEGDDRYLYRIWGFERDITAFKHSRDKLNQMLESARILNDISRAFVSQSPQKLDEIIQYALGEVGKFLEVDAITISEISPDKMYLSVTYEWLNEGMHTVKHFYQNVPLSGNQPITLANLVNHGHVIISDTNTYDEDESAKNSLEKAGIRSAILFGLKKNGELFGIFGPGNKARSRDWNLAEKNFLSLVVDIIAQGIVKARDEIRLKQKETILKNYYEDIKFDLQIAKLTQDAWITKQFPPYENIQFSSFFLPVGDIGGDLILYQVPEPNTIDILFGDISGHGISSALISGIITMSFRRLSEKFLSPKEILVGMQSDLKEAIQRNHLSCCLFRLNTATKEATFCFAGHPPVLKWNREVPESIETILTANYPLFLVPDWTGEEICISFQTGDRLLLFSDGIYEIEKEDIGFLGLDAFLLSLRTKISKEPRGDKLIANLIQEALDARTVKVYDDIAVLLLEFL